MSETSSNTISSIFFPFKTIWLQIKSEAKSGYFYLRFEVPIAGLVFMLLIIWELGLVFSPIAGGHAWRQSSTASVAHNFVLESANLFYPRIDWRMEFSGITGMEFPLYQYFTSLFFYLVPTYFDWPGKIISLLFSLMLLRDMILAYKSIPPVYIFSCYFLITEVLLLSSRFMPEIFALFFAYKGWRSFESKNYLASLIFYSLGVLCRPYLVFLCLPLLWEFIENLFKKHKVDFKTLGIGITILFVLYLWYLNWSEYLRLNFGISDRFYGGDYMNFFYNLMDPKNYLTFVEVFQNSYVNLILIPFFFIGIYNYFDLKKIIIFMLTIVGVIGGTGSHMSPHSYYLVAFIPILTYFLASGFYHFSLYKTVSILLLISLVINWYHFRPQFDVYEKLSDIRTELNRLEKNEGLAVVESGSSPHHLHILRVRGWIANSTKIRELSYVEELENKGAKYVYPLKNNHFQKYPIHEWIKFINK
jgi:hypothetical protein